MSLSLFLYENKLSQASWFYVCAIRCKLPPLCQGRSKGCSSQSVAAAAAKDIRGMFSIVIDPVCVYSKNDVFILILTEHLTILEPENPSIDILVLFRIVTRRILMLLRCELLGQVHVIRKIIASVGKI